MTDPLDMAACKEPDVWGVGVGEALAQCWEMVVVLLKELGG